MDQQQIQVNHGTEFCTFKCKDYNKLFNLEEFLRTQFKLARFRLYYKEKDVEMYLESEKQYEDMINSGEVKQLYLKELKHNDKNFLNLFMNSLFPNNTCCDQENTDCAICLEKKRINPEQFTPLVQECLYDLIQKDDFQSFCKKQFKRNIYDVDEFLELFSRLSRPIKQIVSIAPKQQQQQPQIQISSAIRPGVNQNYSQISKPVQSIIGRSQNIQRSSEYSRVPKSQFITQSKIGLSTIRSVIMGAPLSIRFDDKIKYEKSPEFWPDKQVVFEVCITNDGQHQWPKNAYLKQVGHHPVTTHIVPALNPRESKDMKLSFQAPINAGKYTFTWVLFYKDDDDKEIRIGNNKWMIDFIVKDWPKQQKIDKAVDQIYNRLSGDRNRSEIRRKVINLIDRKETLGISQILNIITEDF